MSEQEQFAEEQDVLFDEADLYGGEPEDVPRQVNGAQDDLVAMRGFMAASQNNNKEVFEWYNKAHDNPPFDPDGMCLKIVRTARNIGAMYPSALSAQHATPSSKRVPRVRDLVRGMIAFYDDPNDSNPYGHVVTIAGRVRDANRRYLSSLVVETNSVVRNRIVRVRGDYFPRHWGDEFQFGATWLNGQDLRLPRPAPDLGSTFKHAISDVETSLRYHKSKGHTRIANALERDLAELRETWRTING